MPAKSIAQQKFFGMVHAAQKGEKAASPEVAKVAKSMKKKDAKDFASTKHKGLPYKKKEKHESMSAEELVNSMLSEAVPAYPESSGIQGSGNALVIVSFPDNTEIAVRGPETQIREMADQYFGDEARDAQDAGVAVYPVEEVAFDSLAEFLAGRSGR